MIGIDLFSGAGGLTLGATYAGIDVKIAVEKDIHSTQTYSFNNPKVKLYYNDIRKFKRADLKRNQPLIIFGGPPCQGFSTSNQKTRTKQNPNNWLFEEFLRVVKIYQPEWIVLENVKGIVETEKGFFLEKILNSFSKIGYNISYKLLNAVHFGVPQDRTRFFLIGSREKLHYEFPDKNGEKFITVKEAINDLPKLIYGKEYDYLPYKNVRPSQYAIQMRGSLKKSYNHSITQNSELVKKRFGFIPQGGNWANIPAKLMKNYTDRSRCHTGIYHRLDSKRPSKVLGNYRKNMLIHPDENRGLSVREAARLQSFPDWYEFKGSIGYQQQQVGNAVPPLLAKVIFNMIINCCS